MKHRLVDITDDILIKILSCEPLKLQYVSKNFYNIIHYNNQISNEIIKKYYDSFNIYKYLLSKDNCFTRIKVIKLISMFFNNNISIYEKSIFRAVPYFAPKRYYWFNCINYSKYVYKYINFFILYYSIFQYDILVDKLNIYVENERVISIEIPLNLPIIKHYILYKNYNNKYEFILRPDNTLDFCLELINKCLE
jgi:hypothetical protein